MSEFQLKIGIIASALSNDARQAAGAGRALGFEGLQFDVVTPSLDLTQLSASGRREFRHVLSAQNLLLIALRIDLGSKGFGPGADIDRQLTRLERAMEAAAGLLAPLVCVDLGPLPAAPAEHVAKPNVSADLAGLIIIPSTPASEPEPAPIPLSPKDIAFTAQLDDALAELGRRADRFSVTLAFSAELASLAAVARALRTADCPWFGIDLDPVAILRDTWDSDLFFSTLGPLVRHVRGRDAVGGSERRTKPTIIGAGSTNWPKLLENLDAAGYHGWITVDPVDLPDRPAAAVAGLKHLRQAR